MVAEQAWSPPQSRACLSGERLSQSGVSASDSTTRAVPTRPTSVHHTPLARRAGNTLQAAVCRAAQLLAGVAAAAGRGGRHRRVHLPAHVCGGVAAAKDAGGAGAERARRCGQPPARPPCRHCLPRLPSGRRSVPQSPPVRATWTPSLGPRQHPPPPHLQRIPTLHHPYALHRCCC